MAAPRNTPQDIQVTPRDLHFDTQAVGKGAWLGGDVVGTAVFNALSLTFPDGERMFMDAVRHYRPQAQRQAARRCEGLHRPGSDPFARASRAEPADRP